MTNLVSNARDALPANGATISIATSRVTAVPERTDAADCVSAPYVGLSVRDTGCGMTAEVLTRAFEPFFTTKQVGMGLGLSQVYGFARQAGGTVRLESTPGCGTVAQILLPRRAADLKHGCALQQAQRGPQ